MKKEKGFSLIELLIVVAIILIIAAIAIPNLLRSRMASNEASAVGTMRAVMTAQTTYSFNYPTVGYADDIIKLGPPADGIPTEDAAGLIDFVEGCAAQPCQKAGYLFEVANVEVGDDGANWGYDLFAVPVTVGGSGQRGFCALQLGDIQADLDGGTDCDVPIQ